MSKNKQIVFDFFSFLLLGGLFTGTLFSIIYLSRLEPVQFDDGSGMRGIIHTSNSRLLWYAQALFMFSIIGYGAFVLRERLYRLCKGIDDEKTHSKNVAFLAFTSAFLAAFTIFLNGHLIINVFDVWTEGVDLCTSKKCVVLKGSYDNANDVMPLTHFLPFVWYWCFAITIITIMRASRLSELPLLNKWFDSFHDLPRASAP